MEEGREEQKKEKSIVDVKFVYALSDCIVIVHKKLECVLKHWTSCLRCGLHESAQLVTIFPHPLISIHQQWRAPCHLRRHTLHHQ